MKKRKRIIIVTIILIAALFILPLCLLTTVWHEDSPDGTYQLCGWLMDQGGFGYSGKIYLREKSPFSAWYQIGTGPSIIEWTSDSTFKITLSYMVNGSFHNEYSVDDFIK